MFVKIVLIYEYSSLTSAQAIKPLHACKVLLSPPPFLNAHSTPSNFKYSGSAKVGKSCFNQRAFSTTSYTTMLKYSETCQTTEGFNPYYIDISIPERVGHEKVKAS